MEISEIEIENYKPINEVRITEVTDLSILVGKNDAGKSSVLEAVRMFLKPLAKPYAEQFHMGNKDDIVITGTFTNVPDELRNELDDDVEFDGKDLEIRREWEYPERSRTKADTFIGGDKLTGTSLPDRDDMNKSDVRDFIWSFLPEVLYVPAERNISEEASFKSNTLIERLLSPLLDENDDVRDQRMDLEKTLDNSVGNVQSSVQDELTQHMDSISEVNIDIGTVDLYKAFSPSITIKDQYSDEQVPIGERGSGIGSMLVLSMIEAYRKEQVGEEYVMLFEEPGNWLHPGAKRQMLNALKSISEDGQVMLSTHSPVFIDRRGDGEVLHVRRDEGRTSIKQVRDDHLSVIENLGVRNSDALQSDFVVWVEGSSDVEMLSIVADEVLDPQERYRVTIQHLGGDNMFSTNIHDIGRINRNFAFLIDSDKKEESDSHKKKAEELKESVEKSEYDNAFVHVLEKREIENYFTPEAINQVIDLSVTEGFVGDYHDIPEKIGRKIEQEHIGIDKADQQEVVCEECGRIDEPSDEYGKSKGSDIVNNMYKNGESIPEIEQFFEQVSERLD